MTADEVTPATMRALAGQAEKLAEAVATAAATMRAAGDEPTRRARFRLDDVIGQVLQARAELEATAEDLARIRARSDCPADWGVCPDHGATLASLAGGRSACTVRGCARAWDYDRAGLPCTEPVAYEVHHAGDAVVRMCAGHARHAEAHLIGGARLVPTEGTR